MKNESNMQATNSKSTASKHAFMAMTGIVIAIICSLVLVREMNPGNDVVRKSAVTESPSGFGFQVKTVFSIGSILK